MSFEATWARIRSHTGEIFHTKSGLPFTYQVVDDCVVPDRTNYPLAKINFEKAVKVDDLTGPGKINKYVRGPSYVYAILTDSRIK